MDVAGGRGQTVGQRVERYRREFWPSATLKSGELVEVELEIDSKNDYEYLVFEDYKAAGFEPVEVRSGYNGNDMGAYVEFRDERVAFFARTFARASTVFRTVSAPRSRAGFTRACEPRRCTRPSCGRIRMRFSYGCKIESATQGTSRRGLPAMASPSAVPHPEQNSDGRCLCPLVRPGGCARRGRGSRVLGPAAVEGSTCGSSISERLR